MRLTLLDLDGSLPPQLSALRSTVTSTDLRDLGPRRRLWSRDRTVRARIRETGAESSIHMFGSDDFHHFATREPITIIHFDNHSDWMRRTPRRHCRTWINRTLVLPQVDRVITQRVKVALVAAVEEASHRC
jgi:hypothetical protein